MLLARRLQGQRVGSSGLTGRLGPHNDGLGVRAESSDFILRALPVGDAQRGEQPAETVGGLLRGKRVCPSKQGRQDRGEMACVVGMGSQI